MIIIDGSYMEGGGQIIRIAVALSAIYKRDITIINIRQGRKTPGLRNQHVACIKSITNITGATVIGNEVKSTKVIIMNHKDITVTNSEIDIKSAGSISLVIQSILPVLLFATKTDYIITIKGGTETYHSPPIDYVKYVLLPTLQRFYVSSTKCELTIIKRGVYPLGGGEVILKITKKCEKVEMKYIPPKLMHHDVWWDEGYVTKKQRKDMPVTILLYKENSLRSLSGTRVTPRALLLAPLITKASS